MKNRILAAMALCCATSSTMPLWAAEYDDPTIVTVEPNLATDGTGGGKYYIYHVATRKFIAAGNASGTQLSVDSIGQEITMAYGEERPHYWYRNRRCRAKVGFLTCWTGRPTATVFMRFM